MNTSTERSALNRLLAFAPHFDLLGIKRSEDGAFIEVEMGQPSIGNADAWARYCYVIDRHSGAIYRESTRNPRDLWLLNI